MEVEDKPGVLSAVASIFSDQGISIEALIQKAPAEGQTRVQLIVLTNKAAQGSVDKAVAGHRGTGYHRRQGHPYPGGRTGRLTGGEEQT